MITGQNTIYHRGSVGFESFLPVYWLSLSDLEFDDCTCRLLNSVAIGCDCVVVVCVVLYSFVQQSSRVSWKDCYKRTIQLRLQRHSISSVKNDLYQ